MNGAGFYKVDPGAGLLYGADVWMPGGIHLTLATKDNFTYPIQGWSYFTDEVQARTFYGLPMPPANWAPETVVAGPGVIMNDGSGRLLMSVSGGTTGYNVPDAARCQLPEMDGTVQWAFAGYAQ